jgi:hypothetical protein
VKPYTLFVHGEVMNRLLQTTSARRQMLLAFFDRLAENPFQDGDFVVNDSLDRKSQVKQVGRWLVTFYADHAVREIQVLDLQPL